MPDTTIKKVEAGTSPRGEMGQRYLVAGKRVSMRLWVQEPGRKRLAAAPGTLWDRVEGAHSSGALARSPSHSSTRWETVPSS